MISGIVKLDVLEVVGGLIHAQVSGHLAGHLYGEALFAVQVDAGADFGGVAALEAVDFVLFGEVAAKAFANSSDFLSFELGDTA